MSTGVCLPLRFLKSVTISFVLLTLRESVLSLHKFLYLFPVLCLVIVCDPTHYGGVISKLEIELEGNLALQSEVYNEYIKDLRTQPCGASVLRMITEEVLLPILTDCGLWVRKSRIQSLREE